MKQSSHIFKKISLYNTGPRWPSGLPAMQLYKPNPRSFHLKSVYLQANCAYAGDPSGRKRDGLATTYGWSWVYGSQYFIL